MTTLEKLEQALREQISEEQENIDMYDILEKGLVKFNGIATWTVYNTGNSGLPENDVTAVAIGGDV